ncbi:MAG: hypothetical protein LBD75_00460 [Candidatus Peribacteria bacterium]|jgi:hypothetical protein|nr:hypothetical protein [Candidatus Peribacteria bacterium]
MLLAVIFAWIVYDSRDLSASVLSLSERTFMETAHRDAAYKKTAEHLEIFISPPLQSYPQLFVSLLFSPSEIQINPVDITSPYLLNKVSETDSSLLLQISNLSTGNVDEGIIIVPFSGNAKDITVEFVTEDLHTSQ